MSGNRNHRLRKVLYLFYRSTRQRKQWRVFVYAANGIKSSYYAAQAKVAANVKPTRLVWVKYKRKMEEKYFSNPSWGECRVVHQAKHIRKFFEFSDKLVRDLTGGGYQR